MSRFRDIDTAIGGGADRFPQTQYSAIRSAGSEDQSVRARAFSVIAESYWKPTYKYLRVKWRRSNEDAKDTTQEFFYTCLEKNYFSRFDPAKATFRTFLRTLIDHFVQNELKAAKRLKRGGGLEALGLDFESAETEFLEGVPDTNQSIEDYFRKEWIRGLFETAIDELRKSCEKADKGVRFRMFEIYDLASDNVRVSYRDLAVQFGMPVTSITNNLSAARREFRNIVLRRLYELTGSEDEFKSEASALLGVSIFEKDLG